MSIPRGRIPLSCPVGFQGRYTVVPGDTIFIIAQRFRTTVQSIIAANPHITNPNLIFPGDVLCVPGQIAFPCCFLLTPRVQVPPGTGASAYVHLSFAGTQALSVVANLPEPSTFGSFDIYLAQAIIPEVSSGPGNQLFPTPEVPPTYSTTIDLPTALAFTPQTRVQILPANSATGISGPVILEGILVSCR